MSKKNTEHKLRFVVPHSLKIHQQNIMTIKKPTPQSPHLISHLQKKKIASQEEEKQRLEHRIRKYTTQKKQENNSHMNNT